jgi:hypothetical protein
LLAQGLGGDIPVPPRGPERVAPAGQQVQKAEYWLMADEVRKLVDRKVLPETLLVGVSKEFNPTAAQYIRVSVPEDREGAIPRERPMARPAPWALILVKSYLRHLCDKHGAHTAELIRYSRPPVYPAFMFLNSEQDAPPDAFMTMVARFGDLERDFAEGHK